MHRQSYEVLGQKRQTLADAKTVWRLQSEAREEQSPAREEESPSRREESPSREEQSEAQVIGEKQLTI